MMLSRFEAADGRLNQVMTVGASIAALSPVIGRAIRPDIQFSGWFYVGIVWFVIAVGIAGYARVQGGVELPNPMTLWRERLTQTEREFQVDALYWAGKAFEANKESIRRKGNWAAHAAGALALSLASFAAWIVL